MAGRLTRALSAATVATVVLGTTAVASAPAQAVAGRCAPGEGVTVVVDYGPLRSGVDLFCDRDGGGKTAASIMTAAGIQWQYTTGQPFMCRIEGYPTADEETCSNTPPANAYWGLFWSDGSPQTWSYASQGASSQRVPNGGSVGWRFQDGGDRDYPGAAPTARPKPAPSPDPSPRPSPEPSQDTGTTAAPGPSRTAESSAPAKPRETAAESTTSEARASATAKPTAEEQDERKGRDERSGRDREQDEDVAVLGSEATADPDETEVTTADSELVEPLGAADDGLGGDDVLLLGLAGLAAAGLAVYGVLLARRRRT